MRAALGATSSDIVRLVLRQVIVVTAGGIAVGLSAAFALSRLLTTVLYGITPHDAASFAAVALVLTCVATLACVVPARRAAKIDPLQAMR